MMQKIDFLTLGIESSCDETAVSVVADGRRMLSNVISSQIDIHTLYGGVVPEIASRHHLEDINGVVDRALSDAGVTLFDIDLIGVTNRPGLIGAVVIGVATAKALSLASGKPLVGVDHMQGHISANYIASQDLTPPFISLVISGGHTEIIRVNDYNDYEVIGATRDDACGEAFDKVARVIGLGYPGGPKIDAAARDGDPDAIEFKRVTLEKGSYDFSFSGIKTQVLNYINRCKMQGISFPDATLGAMDEMNKADQVQDDQRKLDGGLTINRHSDAYPGAANRIGDQDKLVADISASFQEAVLDVVVEKAIKASLEFGGQDPKLVVAGGVAANSALRRKLAEAATEHGIQLYMPDPVLCTDNGAMIGAAAFYKYREFGEDDLTLDAYAN